MTVNPNKQCNGSILPSQVEELPINANIDV